MTPGQVRKHYPDADSCRIAVANYRWLSRLEPALRLPALLAIGPARLDFAFVPGRHAEPNDLAVIAANLGTVHATAHIVDLDRARLDRDHLTAGGHLIPDFVAHRIPVICRRLASGMVHEPHLDADQAIALMQGAVGGPATFYKDTNLRNLLVTPTGPVTVDFDDLALAPFGYDLAKLVVTLAMTHGPIPAHRITAALSAYNTAVEDRLTGFARVGWTQLLGWANIHHILTSPYLGSGGYRHRWEQPDP
jgi:Ser/Thr protein kinase RdoA (MazF antagonist)